MGQPPPTLRSSIAGHPGYEGQQVFELLEVHWGWLVGFCRVGAVVGYEIALRMKSSRNDGEGL